ncbi:cobalamin B12-binding domain-containing protein [Acidisoma sp. 7E03]
MSSLDQQGTSDTGAGGQGACTLNDSSVEAAVVRILRDERTPQRRQAAIERVIEADIIPRLLASYRARAATAAPPPPSPAAARPARRHRDDEAVSLAEGVIGPDPQGAVRSVLSRLVKDGEAGNAACLELIADAARHLGFLWVEDRAGFEEVTLGMFHLQRMAHDIAPMTRRIVPPPGEAQKTLLLLTLQGEQHRFGASLLANCFDSAGWQVSHIQVSSSDDVASLVSTTDYDVVGLSMATDVQVSHVDHCIKAIRAASHNRNVIIMVGGAMILATPSLVETLGADGTGASAAEATERAEELLSSVRRPKGPPSSAG